MIIATKTGWIRDGNASLTTGPGTGIASAGPVTSLHVEHRYELKGDKIVRQLLVSCVPPDPIGTFRGIEIWIEDPDQSATGILLADGIIPWDGGRGLVGTGWGIQPGPRVPYTAGDVVLIDDLEPVEVTRGIRIYVNSYNTDDVGNPLVRANESGPTPSVVVTIPPPSFNAGRGHEYAPVALSFAFSGAQPNYHYESGGDVLWSADFTFVNPTADPRYPQLASYDLMIEFPDGNQVLDSRWPRTSGVIRTKRTYSVPPVASPYRAWLVSVDPDGYQNSVVPGITPHIDFTVEHPTGGPGEEYAPVAQGFVLASTGGYTAGVKFSYQDGGDVLYGLGTRWNRPDIAATPKLGGYDLVIEYADGRRELAGSFSANDTGQWHSDYWPLNNTGVVFIFWLVSFDTNDRRNTIVDGTTPKLTTTVVVPSGPSGEERAPSVTSPSASISYAVDVDGGELWGFTGSWTLPATDPRYGGVRIIARNQADGALVTLGQWSPTDTTFRTSMFPLLQAVTWDLYFISIDTNERANSLVVGTSPRVMNLTVTAQTTGRIKLNRTDTSTFNPTEFEITFGGQFQAKLFAAEKIFVGSVLRVGGGSIAGVTAPSFNGSNGQIAVYNSSNTLRAWMGQNGAVFGGWFGELYVGGTGPGTAPLYANASGQVIVGGISSGTPFISLQNSSAVEVGRLGANIDGAGFNGGWFKQFRVGGPSISSPVIQSDASGNVSINGATFKITNGANNVELDSTGSVKTYLTGGGQCVMFNGLFSAESTTPSAQKVTITRLGITVSDAISTVFSINTSFSNSMSIDSSLNVFVGGSSTFTGTVPAGRNIFVSKGFITGHS